MTDIKDDSIVSQLNFRSVVQPKNHGSLPKFRKLVEELFVRVESITRNKEFKLNTKSNVIERFIRDYRQSVGDDILPVARLFFPKWDRERIYMMKEYKLGKLVCDYLNLSKDTEDYKRVKGWKRLSYNRFQSKVKFSDLLADIISRRRIRTVVREEDALGVDDVNSILDKLHGYAEDSRGEQLNLIKGVIDKMSDNEIRFFFRIVLKSNPVNSENVFLRCWHPDARRLYDLTHDLKVVFWGLSDPTVRLSDRDRQIRLMLPFTPQRCERVGNEYAKIASGRFHDMPFLVEEKFDGERMQVHIQREKDLGRFKFRYFTRNAMDYTSIYGEFSGKDTDSTGCISPWLGPSNFHPNMRNCILDGEMICFDPVLKIPLPYSVVKTFAANREVCGESDDKGRNPHPMFVAFDCVYLNDVSLESYPLDQRKAALKYVVSQDIPHLFTVADYSVARSGEEIEKAMSKAIGTDSEGIVLKDMKSKYVVGSTSKQWIKVKPEYLEEFGENLDLVLVGKIPATKTSFLCALRDDSEESNDKLNVDALTDSDCKFVTLCKISNGLSMEDYRYIDRSTEGKWEDINLLPSNSELIKFGKTIPVLWIDPRVSIVIEARARSITRQPSQASYATDTTLYNAYCVRIRTDKDWRTASTLSQYEMSSNQAKLQSSQSVFQKGKIKRFKYPSKKMTMLGMLNEGYNDEPEADKGGDLFKNYVFSIKTDCMYKGKLSTIGKLNHVVVKFGGVLARNPESVVLDSDKGEKLMIVAEIMTNEVRNFRDRYNVFKFKWCEDCIAAGELLTPVTSHLLFADPILEAKAKANSDRFGGNTIIPLDRLTFWQMAEKGIHNVPTDYKQSTSQLEKYEFHSFLLFYKMKFKVIYSRQNSVIASMLQEEIEINGGEVIDALEDASMVLVISFEEDLRYGRDSYYGVMDETKKIMEERASLRSKRMPRVVTYKYIGSCISEGSLVDPSEFRVVIPGSGHS
ncbi:DEKNAAC101950 [Brettanomyces naardenensis]|uniref:DNA ligase n=1 Tax=Brettanomyces naardenensis TaxID=13370 RepID=A0A448YJD3_BRENA|nr:DEKNAAC101950 [Brettanomyces naardenensis]